MPSTIPSSKGGTEEMNKTESPDSDSYGLGESSSTSSSDGRGLDMLGNDSSHYGGTSREFYAPPEKSEHNEKEEPNMFARRRISNTFRWKLFVIVLMLINTTFVITATSLFLKHEEQQEFERSFDSTAKTFVDAAHAKALALTSSLELLGDLITAYTLDASGTDWPFITLPHFEERVAPLRGSSSGSLEMLGYLPLVRTMQREWWEGYSVGQQGWVLESHQLYDQATITEQGINNNQSSSSMSDALLPPNEGDPTQDLYSISPQISSFQGQHYESNPQRGPYAPLWQISPPPPFSETAMINTDLLSDETLRVLFESLLLHENNASVVASTVLHRPIYSATTTPIMKSATNPDSDPQQAATSNTSSPRSVLLHAIHESYNHRGDIQAFAMGVFQWKDFFSEMLPDELDGVDVVLYNPCSSIDDNEQQESFHTFRIEGREATYLGSGDYHQAKHTKLCQETTLIEFEARVKVADSADHIDSCNYELRVFPSEEYRVALKTNGPAIFTAVVAAVFLATGMVFWLYISLVGSRQSKVMALAMSTSAIVASLFPTAVRDQILQNAEEEVQELRKSDKTHKRSHNRGSSRLNASLKGRRASLSMSTKSQPPQRRGPPTTKPIANLFPEATVLFADIAGFTAWSSSREPTQVFVLLETIYHSFDQIARRRGVFKVETIGDCYVAVTGLPDPCDDHAVVMCKFARDCIKAMEILTKKLEVTLGPDTGELTMRVGMHSGPVTAGVLRGERSRYQLFGDTVNTAARMESNGAGEKIHISQQTADQLSKAGREDWYVARKEKIVAKGKGELQTFWLHTKKCEKMLSDHSESEHSLSVEDWLDLPEELMDSNKSKIGLETCAIRQCLSEQNQRLAEWNSNQLLILLGNLVAHRAATRASQGSSNADVDNGTGEDDLVLGNSHLGVGQSSNVVNDVTDTLVMPQFDGEAYVTEEEHSVPLSELVQQQLHDYVSIICSMYEDNPFHNYQHASHVTMAVVKLLSSASGPQQKDDRNEHEGARLHSKTFGISSDPMAHFALAFAALIHDVDHPGVTNEQLVKENGRLARIYENKSVAEQNSFQTGWDLLMDPSYDHLRAAIYTTKAEFDHFRGLVVNSIVATDLFDKDTNENRMRRWESAFPPQEAGTETSKASERELRDRRATLVMEYLIQTADACACMQHWNVYRKWNERLFHERMKAYKAGREAQNPCDVWYEQELDFFDNTILPLANKMKACGAFGSFDESISFASHNRQEWERNGMQIVIEMENTFRILAGMGDFSMLSLGEGSSEAYHTRSG